MTTTKTVTRLPEATRESQVARWGLHVDRLGDHSATARRGAMADDAPPQGEPEDSADGSVGFLRAGGWHAVEPRKGTERGGGTTSHRGVVHPDEFIDQERLRAAACQELGFTPLQVAAVYRQGPLSPGARVLRNRIDARLLELANAGGLMIELARALGWAVTAKASGSGGPTCRTLDNALGRARMRSAA